MSNYSSGPYPPQQQGPARELVKTRCKQGKLIITEQQIVTEGMLGRQAMARGSITGVSYKVVVIPFFGLGGGGNLIFHGQGTEALRADMVKNKVARQIMAMLGY